MRIVACGVRGSTPAPGSEFARVGGHTSCLAVFADGGSTPRLLLDAGTGLRRADGLMGGAAFAGSILLTHLHWDHVQGLPFFRSGDRDDAVVRLLAPAQGEPLVDVLTRAMSPPHFPIGPTGLRGAWTFEGIDEGPSIVEGFEVTARDIPHKGGRTFGYRVADTTGAFAYLPDHLPATAGSPERAAALDLARGVDALVHDAQFVAGEDAIAAQYGHATVEQAIDLAVEAGVGRLVLFHHGPGRTDDQVREIADRASAGTDLRVVVACEGAEL